jgi:aminoglycoside phosphotransferase (APT) family kinase protein
MAPQSEPPSVSDGLATALAPVVGAPVEISDLRKLTGGASRETWSFTANGEALILRRDPPGRPGAPGQMRREADIMRACTRASRRPRGA